MTDEYKLLDGGGKIIATGTENQIHAFLKHDAADGRYRITGPKYKIHCLRKDGIVVHDPDGVSLENA